MTDDARNRKDRKKEYSYVVSGRLWSSVDLQHRHIVIKGCSVDEITLGTKCEILKFSWNIEEDLMRLEKILGKRWVVGSGIDDS